MQQASKSVGGHRMSSKMAPQKKNEEAIISNRASKETADFVLSSENQARVQHCKNILSNQRLYAETILINARTGKRVKEQYRKGGRNGGGRGGKTAF